MRTFSDVAGLRAAVGERLGESSWLAVEDDRLERYAEATGGSPYLAVALIPALTREIFVIEGTTMAINYGANSMRFGAPLAAGSKVRAVTELLAAEEAGTGVQVTYRTTIELEGGGDPACVAEHIGRYSF